MVGELDLSVKYWWNDTDKRKLKYSREKCVPLALYPPQIPYGLAKDQTQQRPVSNCLNPGKAHCAARNCVKNLPFMLYHCDNKCVLLENG